MTSGSNGSSADNGGGDTTKEASALIGLTIGALTLTPKFDSGVTEYTAATTNATNKVTATAAEGASVAITVNGTEIDNGTSAAWVVGENTVTIVVAETGKAAETYTVVVTKS